MTRDPRFDLLFTPMRIGPVTAPNRFYQVPHCTGMGHERPHTLAAMRGMKAEGGWGVVCTEYCSIHPTQDDAPFPVQTLWDDDDIRQHALMTDAVHQHGALAGIELFVGGNANANMHSRLPPLGLTSLPVVTGDPVQCRALDRQDIDNVRHWHIAAAKRAVIAGFDIVYVYASHHYLLHSFLHPALNQRRDEYGGSVENRLRIVKELLQDVRDAVAGKAAVALRWSSDGDDDTIDPDQLEMVTRLNGLPDIWDVTINDYTIEMGTSRQVREGALEEKVKQIREIVTGPIVTVGRYTSPESMLRLVKSGTADFIGAARPSIADPFLPNKIREGRFDDIRECIGCNICYAHNSRSVPIRCTQNPTMGEEWRHGWHPEAIASRASDERLLIVGAGPAGLEAARALGQRGYEVAIAESSRQAGGRVTLESSLPGFAEWARVRDWRLTQIDKMANVTLYLESPMNAADVKDFGADHVVLATGSTWRLDGTGRTHQTPILDPTMPGLISPESILRGELPAGSVAIYDDDGYYLASALADKLLAAGCVVHFITSAGIVAPWTQFTGEQDSTHRRLLANGAKCLFNKELIRFAPGRLEIGCRYGGASITLEVAGLIPVTSRAPRDDLYAALQDSALQDTGGDIRSITRIGDAEAPATIAHAVYAGHRFARLFGQEASLGHETGISPRRDRGLGLPVTASQ